MNEKWVRYMKEWESEHPNKKPPKIRFTIINEFLKEKLSNETNEMKAWCEEYWLRKEESSVTISKESAANAKF